MDEQSGHLFHALPHKGLQRDLLRREIGMDRTNAQIAQHHVHILFGLEQLLGKGAAARDIRAFLQQKAHGRQRGFDLVGPKRIIFRRIGFAVGGVCRGRKTVALQSGNDIAIVFLQNIPGCRQRCQLGGALGTQHAQRGMPAVIPGKAGKKEHGSHSAYKAACV